MCTNSKTIVRITSPLPQANVRFVHFAFRSWTAWNSLKQMIVSLFDRSKILHPTRGLRVRMVWFFARFSIQQRLFGQSACVESGWRRDFEIVTPPSSCWSIFIQMFSNQLKDTAENWKHGCFHWRGIIMSSSCALLFSFQFASTRGFDMRYFIFEPPAFLSGSCHWKFVTCFATKCRMLPVLLRPIYQAL